VAIVICALLVDTPVRAQADQDSARRPELHFRVGYAAFVDEDPIDHLVIGGSARLYLTPRLSVEPELTYMRGPGEDRDLFVLGNIAFDFRREGALVPYVIGGGGWMRHRNEIFGAPFSHDEAAAAGGAGMRLFLSDRFFVAPEFRLGWELHYQITGTVGFRFER